METAEYPAAGTTGLALTVGELREKVAGLKEEWASAETDLRAADARDKSELSGIDQRQQTALDALSRSVSALTERVAALESRATAKPPPAPPLPTRHNGERNQAYHPRVVAWAKQTGKPEPPKPQLGEDGRDYARRVRDFCNGK